MRGVGVRRAVAAVAAAVAAFSAAAPTGVRGVDLAWTAALAATVVIIGARASRWVLVAVAAVTTLAAIGTAPATFPAALALGAALAIALSTPRSPVGAAVVAGAVVNALLRLDHPRPFGATAVLATVLLAVLLVSGWRGSRASARHQRGRYALAAGAVLVLLAVAGVAGVAWAARPLQRGVSFAGRGLDAGRAGDRDGAQAALETSAASLGVARDRLETPWVAAARLVPVLSQQIRVLHDAAATGSELSIVGLRTANAANLDQLRVQDGAVDLNSVSALADPLTEASDELHDASRRLAAGDSPWLGAPLAARLHRNRARLERAEVDAARVAAVARVLPDVLGRSGPRRYFLAIQTPSELRGSGGIIGSFGEVTAVDGHVHVGEFGRSGDLNTNGVPPDDRTLTGPADYLARYARFEPTRIWQNVTISPDFPAVGSVISQLYPQSGGSAIDGVISVDPSALARLLSVLGPVTVAPWPEPITAANAEQVLLYDQYVRLQGEDRVDFLGKVAKAVASKLTTGTLPPAADLVRAMAPAVADHHLLLWSPSPAEQRLYADVGADGALRASPAATDFVAVVNNNAGGNKLDWFLRRSSDYRARIGADGAIEATVDVTLRNDAPTAGLNDYVRGVPGPVSSTTTNRTFVSVYTPWALQRATLDGAAVPMESQLEGGVRVYSLFTDVPAGATVHLVLQLRGRPADGKPYVLDIHRQPLVQPDAFTAHVPGPTARH
jgi:hypothetical protein